MRKLLFLAILILPASCFGSAANAYVTSTGGAVGNCPAVATTFTPAQFNSSANWGSGANQIGAGTTVLICGTITFAAGATGLQPQGDGSAGSPITIKFDTTASLQAPYFAGYPEPAGCQGSNFPNSCGGAINIVGHKYITIDGGSACGISGAPGPANAFVACNGSIQNTANGSALTYRAPSTGIYIGPTAGNVLPDHILVKNLTISNIYNNTSTEINALGLSSLSLTSVAASGGNATYTGTITNGGSNALVGMLFNFSGFTNSGNNGSFLITASSTTTLTVANGSAVNETHAGTAGSSCGNNSPGFCNSGIHVQGDAGNIEICGNVLQNSHALIDGNFSGSGAIGPSSCTNTQAADGVNIHHNYGTDAAWGLGHPGGNGAVSIYNNELADSWTNWQYPIGNTTSQYHMDGVIALGEPGAKQTLYIYNNYIHGDMAFPNASPTAFIYCSYGSSGNGSGTSCNVFNNLLIGTGTMATGGSNAASLVQFSQTGSQSGPHAWYNNTFKCSGHTFYVLNALNAGYLTWKNNVFQACGQSWYIAQNVNNAYNSITASNNDYFGSTRVSPWNYGPSGQNYSSLSAWQAGSGIDANSSNGDPNLDANYKPQAGSAVSALGADLSGLCSGPMTALCQDMTGIVRLPGAGWDAGALSISAPANPSVVSLFCAGNGNGKQTAAPYGLTTGDGQIDIQCAAGVATCVHGTQNTSAGCSANYANNATVNTISATAAAGYALAGIAGAAPNGTLTCTASTCNLNTGTGNVTITATFTSNPTCSLTISPASINQGASTTVTATVANVNAQGGFWQVTNPDGTLLAFCAYPSACAATGSSGNFSLTQQGNYTLTASLGVACTPSVVYEPIAPAAPYGQSNH